MEPVLAPHRAVLARGGNSLVNDTQVEIYRDAHTRARAAHDRAVTAAKARAQALLEQSRSRA
jgi:hypothetical protein